MKAFNLQEAINGAKVISRDGREVINLFARVGGEGALPLLAVFKGKKVRLDTNGRMFEKHDTPNDLFIASKEKVEFLNLYKAPTVGARMSSTRHHSIESAKNDATCHAVCIVKVTTIDGKTTAEIVHTY